MFLESGSWILMAASLILLFLNHFVCTASQQKHRNDSIIKFLLTSFFVCIIGSARSSGTQTSMARKCHVELYKTSRHQHRPRCHHYALSWVSQDMYLYTQLEHRYHDIGRMITLLCFATILEFCPTLVRVVLDTAT